MKNHSILSRKVCFLACWLLVTSFQISFGQADTIRLFHIGLVYPVSSNGLNAMKYTNRFSLHSIAGISKNETDLAISGVANIVGQNASGLQMAGVVNVIGNTARGVQLAGFANVVKRETKSVQAAGFLNLTGNARGVQIAGFGNIARGDARGIQLSGFLNAGKNVNTQVSGFLNVAKNVKGVQLAGFMNVADSSDYPIGLFNFIKNGEKSVGISVDETLTSITSFRSGGRVLYGIVGVGYNFKNSSRSLYALEAGLGAHMSVVRNFRVNAELMHQYLSDFKEGEYWKGSLRILPAYKVGNRLEVFAGPTFNYVNNDQDQSFGFIEKYVWSKNGSVDFQGLYFGFNAGLHVIL